MSINRSIFEKASKHNREWGGALLADLELSGSERILDLGCGDGVISELLAQRVPQGEVVAVNLSEPVPEIELPHDRENLHFRCMGLSGLSFLDEFDLIFSHAVLHWVRDHKLLLFRLRRAMRQGGRIFGEFAASGNCGTLCHTLLQTMEEPEYREYFEGFEWPWYMPEEAEYSQLLAGAGFTAFHVEKSESIGFFESPEEVLAWLDTLSLVPFRDALPEHLRECFRDDVAVGFIDRCRKPGGIYQEQFCRLRVTATK